MLEFTSAYAKWTSIFECYLSSFDKTVLYWLSLASRIEAASSDAGGDIADSLVSMRYEERDAQINRNKKMPLIFIRGILKNLISEYSYSWSPGLTILNTTAARAAPPKHPNA